MNSFTAFSLNVESNNPGGYLGACGSLAFPPRDMILHTPRDVSTTCPEGSPETISRTINNSTVISVRQRLFPLETLFGDQNNLHASVNSSIIRRALSGTNLTGESLSNGARSNSTQWDRIGELCGYKRFL
ncbi:hypothetical protein RRG08_049875 [Elysia crispata]|uniref:Uncharacterized protein n=1 Tax=Elysia crispata TaxID=231223 RepID=A0AAE0Y055_9GAST|nr:hypothetical protein RRG08_049875 [Elysia crispata]